ncbi:MAG: twin transmembrane helix small protein [Azospirillum sp.]|nr:twin transmembrane helix small protein [Azospirillum sp.]
MSGLFSFLMALAMAAVLGTLFVGVFTMVRGNDPSGRASNRFMRARVLLQGLALVLFALAMMTAR